MTALIRGCALAVMGETFGHLPLFPSQTSQGGHESVSRNSSIVLQFCLSTQDFAVSSHMLQPGFALCPRGLLQEQNLQYHIFEKVGQRTRTRSRTRVPPGAVSTWGCSTRWTTSQAQVHWQYFLSTAPWGGGESFHFSNPAERSTQTSSGLSNRLLNSS